MRAATCLTDSSVTSAADPIVARDEMTDPPSGVATALDGAELETRHLQRRALRILTAARRRDDGGVGPTVA